MPRIDSKKLDALFEKYKEPDEDIIGPDGLQKMYEEMQVDLDDIVTLVFAWKLGAERLCEFTRTEFVGGLTRLRVDNLQTLRQKMDDNFRTFYLWCFDYYKGSALKSMDLEMAKELWKQILAARYKHLDLWIEFLDTKRNVITRDTYTLFLSFTKKCKDDFSDYDEAAAWPVLIDEFVEYARDRV